MTQNGQVGTWHGKAKLIVVCSVILGVVGLALFTPLQPRLSGGGFVDPSAASARVDQVLQDENAGGGMPLLLLVSGDDIDESELQDTVEQISDRLDSSPDTTSVLNPYRGNGAYSAFLSDDGQKAIVYSTVRGDDDVAPDRAEALTESIENEFGGEGVTIAAGGQTTLFTELNTISTADVTLAESIAIPLTFIILCFVFRSFLVALLPMLAGLLSIAVTMIVLYIATLLTDTSVFSMNLTIALGLALSIDYSLLIIARHSEKYEETGDYVEALTQAMRSVSRAILFSALTVAIAMAGTLFFDLYFLSSMAYAGIAVVVAAAVLSLLLVPALLLLFRRKIEALWSRSDKARWKPESRILLRTTTAVLKRPIAATVAAVAILVVIGLPALGMKIGLPDDRVLQQEASSRSVGDIVRSEFPEQPSNFAHVQLIGDGAAGAVQTYCADAAQYGVVLDCGSVRTGGDSPSAIVTVALSDPDPYSSESIETLDNLQAIAPDSVDDVLLGGLAAQNRDTVDSIVDSLPWAVLWIVVATVVLLGILTRSVAIPLKTIVISTLSLTGSFGVLVWVFQEGHLGGLGTEPMGVIVASVPVLLFCIAFGLSMDYEVLLVSRIREEWSRGRSNDQSILAGMARSGKVITVAAILMMIVFLSLGASGVTVLRALGVGLAIAVFVDVTIVRLLLLPALMKLFGNANWWPGTRSTQVMLPVEPREEHDPVSRYRS